MSINLTIAWRNIWRNTRRSVITISAIVFASGLLVFMLSWQLGSYQSMINSSVQIQTGHIQVQAKGYHEEDKMWQVVPDPAVVYSALKETPDVKMATSRANSFSVVSSDKNTYGVLVKGIDPVTEAQVSNLKIITREGSYLAEDDTDKALVGDLLAKNMQVGLGDRLTVLGQGRDGSIAAMVVTVKGIYKSGMSAFDRSTLHIPLTYFQNVYSMGDAVHEVVIICDSLDDVAPVKTNLGKRLEKADKLVVLDWEELMPGLIQMIKMDFYSGLILYFILIIVVAFSIFNTFLMSMFERTREFGVMMALGTTPGRLTKLLLSESMIMTLLGVAAGLIVGSLITWYFQVHGLTVAGEEAFAQQYGLSSKMNPQLSLVSAFAGPAAVLFFTFLIALYPTFKIRRLRPVEAMRYV